MSTTRTSPSSTFRYICCVGGLLTALTTVACDSPESEHDLDFRGQGYTVQMIEFSDGESAVLTQNNSNYSKDIGASAQMCMSMEMEWSETENYWSYGTGQPPGGCVQYFNTSRPVPATAATFADLGIAVPANLHPADKAWIHIQAINFEECSGSYAGTTLWEASVSYRPYASQTNTTFDWNGSELSLAFKGCSELPTLDPDSVGLPGIGQ
ncbi:MAG: hypothetical protein K0V04_16425 [Deltaproteobacteria bacterium]|nr:hypothetical protein [Deltaproteobacteria bacterium]